jgi:eukaryotic-like serine/threonine-protein kinase
MSHSEQDTLSDPGVRTTPDRDALADYDLGAVIGTGGMGEVVVARDRRVGRDVAVKRLRRADPTHAQLERFLREAKIQARLDHPAIVPVHEVGFDAQGQPFFVMKRLAGVTFAYVLAVGDASLQKRLRVLVEVCNAIELAHARGVVHRDLKPQNIMVGDYGEVYVIDWGIARVLGSAEPMLSADIESVDTTLAGQVLGTPGYMAPEQVEDSGDVGPAADVYSLGAILFEVLAGETLHPPGRAALRTRARTDVSPAERRPERAIAPELDAACIAALAFEPARRSSVRELREQIQRYLDGDRDVERRRELARELVAKARAALVDPARRAEAMHLAGRALALDPDAADANQLASHLILEPPRQIPAELAADLVAHEVAASRDRSRRAIVPFALYFVFLPVMPLLGVSSWPLLVALTLAMAGLLALAVYNWRVGPVPVWLFLVLHALTAILFSQLASPLHITPILVAGILLSLARMPWVNERRWAVLGWTLIAVATPLVLEWAGVFASSWDASVDGLVARGNILAVTIEGSYIIVIANVMLLMLIANYSFDLANDRRIVERKLAMQAWHLGQLLPRR